MTALFGLGRLIARAAASGAWKGLIILVLVALMLYALRWFDE